MLGFALEDALKRLQDDQEEFEEENRFQLTAAELQEAEARGSEPDFDGEMVFRHQVKRHSRPSASAPEDEGLFSPQTIATDALTYSSKESPQSTSFSPYFSQRSGPLGNMEGDGPELRVSYSCCKLMFAYYSFLPPHG